jgi:hypothetical protein
MPNALDRDVFRHAIGRFATGVTVITARRQDSRLRNEREHGLLVVGGTADASLGPLGSSMELQRQINSTVHVDLPGAPQSQPSVTNHVPGEPAVLPLRIVEEGINDAVLSQRL